MAEFELTCFDRSGNSYKAALMLQACGAAALNQVQDAHIDVLMERTARRPIPAGRISRRAATLFALGLLAAGSVVLGFFGLAPMLLGLGAAVVYNLVYTPLKRVTPFAALPGALIGALPPVVGWSAAGGYLSDPSIHLVAFFFFIWQIPHFWLLLLFYHRDYADGGLPSLFDRFDRRQIVKLTFIWIAALAVSALLLPLVHLFDEVSLAYVVAAAGLLVVVGVFQMLDRPLAQKVFQIGGWDQCALPFLQGEIDLVLHLAHLFHEPAAGRTLWHPALGWRNRFDIDSCRAFAELLGMLTHPSLQLLAVGLAPLRRYLANKGGPS